MKSEPLGLFSVKMVSELTGVGSHTLRAWERRYQAVVPSRSTSGQRAYGLSDVERIRTLKRLVDLGFSIGQVARLSQKEIQGLLKEKGIANSDARSRTEISIAGEPKERESVSHGFVQQRLLSCVIKELRIFNLHGLNAYLARSRHMLSPRDFALCVAVPVLKSVGELVELGQMSVSQEHALSAIMRDHLGHMTLSCRGAELDNGKRSFIFATPEGDYHEFGILLAQILTMSCGFSTHYFGASMPADALADAANAIEATHLVLALNELPKERLPMPVNAYLSRLIKGLSHPCEIWLGGEATRLVNESALGKRVRIISSLREYDSILLQLIAE